MTPQERKAALEAEQSGKSRAEIAAEMEQRSEYSLDLDGLPSQAHNWVKRGIVVSCEGAGHPHHSHFLVKRNI